MKINLQTIQTFNKLVKMQKKTNILNCIRDKVVIMYFKGYSPQATNIKTLIKQYRKGNIIFQVSKVKLNDYGKI